MFYENELMREPLLSIHDEEFTVTYLSKESYHINSSVIR